MAEITRFVVPILAAGPYRHFAGMYTAILPVLAGLWTLAVLIRGRAGGFVNRSPSAAGFDRGMLAGGGWAEG